MNLDRTFMRRALALAALGKFTAPPNPAVGAVLVREDRVIGEGFHARAGQPHAEAQALARGGDARGATLYVNLEPCCHVGRTPPCVTRILASGVRRVVAAHADPDPRVRGGGFRHLAAGGVENRVGVLEAEALALNAGYFHVLRSGRPWVTVKAATSADGVMAPPGIQWITRRRSRRHGRVLRREHDAILTGIATVVADDPRMDPRPRLGARPLLRIILDPKLRIASSARILKRPDRDPVLIVSGPGVDSAARRHIERRGVEVVEAPMADASPSVAPPSGRGSQLDLEAVLQRIGDRGVRSLLVEAGPRLTSSFLQEGLANRLVLYMAPRFLGRGEGTGLFDSTRAPAAADRQLPRAQPFQESARYACLGPDLFADFLLERRPAPASSRRVRG